MSLDETRKRIDEIDEEIVRLLDRRAQAGRDAARFKEASGQPLHNPERERQVRERLAAISDGSMPVRALQNIYRVVMAETLAMEAAESTRCDERRDGKRDVTAEVLENRQASPGFWRMRLRAPGMLFEPGQFFQIRIDAHAGVPFLRRPFAPSEYLSDGFAFHYAVVGDGTRAMTRLAPGRAVGVLAPLGTGYAIAPAGSRVALIGGGCGAPSLLPLAALLKRSGVKTTALVGARTISGLLDREAFAGLVERLILATDDGSCGCQGTTIDAFRLEKIGASESLDRIYACGPLPMLRSAAALAEELGIACEVSLEERMACGFGACVGCAVPVKKSGGGFVYRRVCHEGPVFDAKTLAWGEMR